MICNHHRVTVSLLLCLVLLCISSSLSLAQVESLCPPDMQIIGPEPPTIHSIYVHNAIPDVQVISYLLTDSRGWLCSVQAGMRSFQPDQTMELWGALCPQNTISLGTSSLFSLKARHQNANDGPALTLSAGDLGAWSFRGLEIGGYPQIHVEPGQILNFSWGGEGEYYRFGWDVVDVFDEYDPGWAVQFTNSYLSTGDRHYYEGVHTITVQALDGNAYASLGGVMIIVVPVPGILSGTSISEIPKIIQSDTTAEPSFSECAFEVTAATVATEKITFGRVKVLYR